MVLREPDEVQAEYIAKMGGELGSTFYAMVGEVFTLRCIWSDYVALWGHSPERVDILNKSAATFFYRCERIYRHEIILHIARLTDATKNQAQRNLSIRCLPEFILDADFRKKIQRLVALAVESTKFVVSWRNLALAHKDHDFALKRPEARKIVPVSRIKIREAIEAIEAVLKALCRHYCDADIAFDVGHDGAAEELVVRLEESVAGSRK